MKGLLLTAVVLLVAFACGGSADLTCEYLSDPGNCWAAAAEAAGECLPPSDTIGVLAADRSSCSYPDGTRILFDDPLPLDISDLDRFAFTIETDGSECARFVDTFANRMELEAGNLSAVSELHAGGEFHLHCGDGASYESDFDLLFECPPGTAPTDGFDVTADSVTFSISAVTTPGELFRCQLAVP